MRRSCSRWAIRLGRSRSSWRSFGRTASGGWRDVRTIPRSRHNPQFNREALSRFLRNRRISYRHMKSLGGLRRALPDSQINAGWRNASFRGFADYMQTPEFDGALDQLVRLAADRPTAILCAESVPWRCHRSLIADALTVRGIRVRHIFSATNAKPHALTPMAKVRGTHVTYPTTPVLTAKGTKNTKDGFSGNGAD